MKRCYLLLYFLFIFREILSQNSSSNSTLNISSNFTSNNNTSFQSFMRINCSLILTSNNFSSNLSATINSYSNKAVLPSNSTSRERREKPINKFIRLLQKSANNTISNSNISNISLFNFSVSSGFYTSTYTNCNNLSFYTDMNLINSYKNFCPSVSCSNMNINYNESCMIFKNLSNRITINTCPSRYKCPLTSISTLIKNNDTNYTCSPIQLNIFSNNLIGSLVDFDFCKSNSDCAGLNCVNNTCIGKPFNSYCRNNFECSAGTYCDMTQLLCLPRLTSGGVCKADGDCSNELGCFNNSCTPYFSFSAGTVLTNNANDKKFCLSNYAFNNNYSFICDDLINVIPYPYFCNTLAGCTYKSPLSNSSIVLNNSCNCDLSGNGYAYCHHDTNSAEYFDYIGNLNKTFKTKCHFFNKGSCSLTPYRDILNLNYAVMRYFQLNLTSGNYSCLDPQLINLDSVQQCIISDCQSSGFPMFNLIVFCLYLVIFL